MARRALMAGLLLPGLALGARAAPAEEIKVETLTPRSGVTLAMLVLRADKPVASVVLCRALRSRSPSGMGDRLRVIRASRVVTTGIPASSHAS
jgi:hypothetical protein